MFQVKTVFSWLCKSCFWCSWGSWSCSAFCCAQHMWAERKLRGSTVSFTWASFIGYLLTLTNTEGGTLGFISQSFPALWLCMIWLFSVWPWIMLLKMWSYCKQGKDVLGNRDSKPSILTLFWGVSSSEDGLAEECLQMFYWLMCCTCFLFSFW